MRNIENFNTELANIVLIVVKETVILNSWNLRLSLTFWRRNYFFNF